MRKTDLILIFLTKYSHVLCRETSAGDTYICVLYRGTNEYILVCFV